MISNHKNNNIMYNNYDYPYGADTPDAPWNEPVIPEHDFEILASFGLQRETTITTDNYIPCCDCGDDDGVGYCDKWDDTSQTVWKEEFHNQYMTPLELIAELKSYVEKDIESREKGGTKVPERLKWLLECCDNWELTEEDYE